MKQLPARLIVLLVDIVVNAYMAASHQAFSLGSLYLDYAQFIVVFNAIMILGIYAVDLIIVSERKYLTRIKIGDRVIRGRLHEE